MSWAEPGSPGGDDVVVTIQLRRDGFVTSEPPFRPSELLPDLPALLRYMADTVIPVAEVPDGAALSTRERARLIELIDRLNNPSVTQLDTDEQAEFSALLAELTS